MNKPRVLLAAEDEALRQVVKELLLRHGFGVVESPDKTAAKRSLQGGRVDLVIIVPPGDHPHDGVVLGAEIRRMQQRVPLILVTERSSEELAVAALRAGISDYFRYPCDLEELAAAMERCLRISPPWRALVKSEATGAIPVEGFPMIGESALMREVEAYIGKIASTDSNVLITGETGTGKELTAGLIHRNSRRRQRPLVCINCAALPDTLLESELFGYERGAFTGAHTLKEGKLKLADGGTLFFDEIGDMNPHAQAKILRVIESKEVSRLGGKSAIPLDVRVIAATNQDLERGVTEGLFRQDLYFRLNVARVHLPPLRDRKEDIPFLCDHYIRELNRRTGLEIEGVTEEVLEPLLRYPWPGNIRELKNLLEAVFINRPSGRISFRDLPDQFQRRLRDAEGSPEGERDRILSALFSTRWNKSKAAQQLQWSRMTLYRKMARYHLGGTGPGLQERRLTISRGEL